MLLVEGLMGGRWKFHQCYACLSVYNDNDLFIFFPFQSRHRGRLGGQRGPHLLRPAGNVDVQAGCGLLLVRDIQQFWRHVRYHGWPLADKHNGKCLLYPQTVCVDFSVPFQMVTTASTSAASQPPCTGNAGLIRHCPSSSPSPS